MIAGIAQSIFILFFIILLIFLTIYLFIIAFSKFFSVMYVQSSSMEPTLKSGDTILVLNRVYRFFLKRGQIIVLSSPTFTPNLPIDSSKIVIMNKPLLVKRLVGLAGDKDMAKFSLAVPIPSEQIFVLGDNPNGQDSRQWGPIPLSIVHGVVIARIGKMGKNLYPSGI